MGGCGSGGGRPHAERRQTTNARTINATELIRSGEVEPERGAMMALYTWEVEYPMGFATYGLHLSATWQPNGYSLRWWLHCNCGRRCSILYQPRWWSEGYACRRCCGLLYPSQCLSPTRRAEYRAEKLFARVNAYPEAETPRKPPRMHTRRFHATLDAAESFRAKAARLREAVRARRQTASETLTATLHDMRTEASWWTRDGCAEDWRAARARRR